MSLYVYSVKPEPSERALQYKTHNLVSGRNISKLAHHSFKTAILTLCCINVLKEKKYLKVYVIFSEENSIYFH